MVSALAERQIARKVATKALKCRTKEAEILRLLRFLLPAQVTASDVLTVSIIFIGVFDWVIGIWLVVCQGIKLL